MNDCAACPALAASKNANPAPVSNKFMLNVLRLRDLLAFLLGAIVAPDYPFAPEGAYGHTNYFLAITCKVPFEWGGHRDARFTYLSRVT